MASLITPQFERYVAEQTIARGTVQFDEFIFANIPGLNENNLAKYLTMPTSAQIVHRQAVSQSGVINENAVVYSVTIGTEVGDFDFNFIGLINRSKNLLAVAVQTDTVKKIRNKNAVQGNSITRNILLEFSGAKALTGINVNANTWQIDFTVRLHGLDEKIRLTNRDLYGRAVFFDDSFLVKRKTGNQFTIQPGVAYVEGVRMDLTALYNLTANNLPCSVYADVVHHCTVTGEYQTEIKYLTQSKADYVDTANRQHYVQILADINRQGNVTDRRLLSPFLGITPKDLDDTTVNQTDETGHTHKLSIASLLKRGIVKLFSGIDSNSEEMAATPKAVKTAFDRAVTAETNNLYQRIYVSNGSLTLDLTNKQQIIDLFGDRYRINGYLSFTAHNNAQSNITGLPLTTKSPIAVTFYLIGGYSSVYCHYPLLGRSFFSSINFNNTELTYKWIELITNTGEQTINNQLVLATSGWSKIKFPIDNGGEWYLEFNPNSETDPRFNFVYKMKDNSKRYCSFPVLRKNEVVAYQDWVNAQIADNFTRGKLTTQNLNDIKVYGIYAQEANRDATLERNYPTNFAGTLIVYPSAYNVMQKYINFRTGETYQRNMNIDLRTWSEWRRIDGLDKVDKSSISNIINGTAKDKVASEFALGELGKQLSLSGSLSEIGWCKLPNGLILQWGKAKGGRVNFPIAFPSKCFSVVGTPASGGNYEPYVISAVNNTSFYHKGKYESDANNSNWIAIGI